MNSIINTMILMVLAFFFMANQVPKEVDSLITEIVVYKNDDVYRFTYFYDYNNNLTMINRFKMMNAFPHLLSRTEWVYENGKCVNQIEHTLVDGKLTLTHKIQTGYERDNKKHEIYTTVTNNLETTYKSVVYDYMDNQIKTISTFNGVVNQSPLYKKVKYCYDINNKLISQNINYITNENNLSQVYNYKYNNQFLADSLIIANIIDGNPENHLLTTFFYHPTNNNLIKQVQKKWDNSKANWLNETKIEYEYDAEHRILAELYYNFTTVFWTPNSKYEYVYDSEGLLLEKIMYQPIYEKWRKIYTISYSEMQKDKPSVIESKYNFWGGETNTYVNNLIPFYFNNEMTVMEADKLELLYILTANDMVIEYENNSDWINIYPNPSNGIFYISTDKYKVESWSVHNLNGQLISSMHNDYHTGLVDLSKLIDGVYMFKAQTVEGRELKQKIIIERSK